MRYNRVGKLNTFLDCDLERPARGGADEMGNEAMHEHIQDRLSHNRSAGAAALVAAMLLLGSVQRAHADSSTPDGARPGNVIGTGSSLPRSDKASNIDPANTRSTIAPSLPVPEDANGPVALLRVALKALQQKQSGLAQESMERAQTRLLDRSVLATDTHPVDQSPVIQTINSALTALAQKDFAGARVQVDAALQVLSTRHP
ncbi:Hypothetical protein GbCGDNIH1_2122 [Granulibacter bethesdensis CGDNIH1]|uniref:Uncharacterized protein n=2 Tax=Granulibacter bethesdensis TaxID=364410 RepID=Q0BQ82_GRABC|nr:Hypothetical protein GbCGDNIH1_2122 [Granulibacter bethesdensis CGDNIH1]APH52892.1 Hypothetical protein GbCGDNIH5_2122 [Granulibacter bethesdensis]APH65580.1 Hypothetical protein GbCGDNIH1I4_2122 [Granulibacter bethesdensis]